MADETVNARSRRATEEAGQDFGNLDELVGVGRDLRNTFRDSTDEVTKAASKTSKALETGWKIFEDSIKRFASYLDASFSKVTSAYESNSQNITTKMQMSQKQYREMWDHYSGEIKKNSYQALTTSREIIEEMNNVLATGLRGKLAQDKAFTDVISKKLVPTLNTSSRRLNDLSVVFGSSTFIQGMAGFQSFLDSQGNFSTSEEYLNQLIDEMSGTVSRWAAQNGGVTEDNYNAYMNNILAAANLMGEGFGGEAVQAFQGWLADAINGGWSENAISALMGGMTSDDMKRILTSTEETGAFLNRAVQTIGPELAKASGDSEIVYQKLLEIYGLSKPVADMIQTSYYNSLKTGAETVDYVEKMTDLIEKGSDYDAESVMKENDFYQTATQRLDNITENMITKTAVATTKFPYFDTFFHEITSALGGILKAIIGGSVASSVLGGGRGSAGGLLAGGASADAITATGSPLPGLAAVAIGYGAGKLLQKTGWGDALGEKVADWTGGFGVDMSRKKELKATKEANAKLQDKNAQAWYQYFDDPTFVSKYLPLVADQDNNGLPDNPAVGQAFDAWRRDKKSGSYTVADYLRDNNLISGSHALGLEYVPYDNYVAALHEGESVLNASSARALRALQELGIPASNANDNTSSRLLERANLITRAIEYQTEVLVSRLDIIIDSIRSSGPVATGTTAAYG